MRTPARLAEILVLAVGGLSVVGLGWASTRIGGDPELTVRAEVERGADQAAQLLRLTWERRLTSPEPPCDGPVVRGTLEDLDAPVRTRAVDRSRVEEGSSVFNTLLAAADRTGDRSAVDEALERYPDAPRRPEAWLLAIQLAVADDDLPAARDGWLAGREELAPEDARGDVAYLLLQALAAAPALSDAERAEAQTQLIGFWAAGRLAVPEAVDTWHDEGPELDPRPRLDPRISVWARALEGLSPAHAADVAALLDRDGRALRALLASVEDPKLPPADGLWHWLRGDGRILLGPGWMVRVEPSGSLALAECDPADVARAVEREAAPGGGFQLAPRHTRELVPFEGGATGAMVPFVSGPPDQALLKTDSSAPFDTGYLVRIAGCEWPLWHTGRDELLAIEVARRRNLRLGFGLLALLSAVAVGFTYTALVRRRRLDDLKSRFVAGVSHDLRTPLASILLMAENLETGRVHESERVAQYHGSIRREATRLSRMVDDVLDFSRLERGEGVKLVKEERRVETLMEQLEVECRERVEKLGGSLRVNSENLPERGFLDAEALRRAVGNLVDNALAHSGSTELELTLRGSEDTLIVEVADAGRGVPAAERERLFRAFEQGSGGDGHTGGSGLGLAIVRELARAHGGDAEFVDQPDGTRVRITVQIADEEGDA